MKYIVYKVENKINKKIYIGVHKTENINDEYLGSGDLIIKAITKYGKENFKKTIISIFDKEKDAYFFESQIINNEFIKNPNTYNIRLGGDGGSGGKRVHKKISESLKGRRRWWDTKSKSQIQKIINKRINTIYEKYGKDGFSTFSDRQHTEETKNKMKLSHKGKHKGIKNSQYGTVWIYSEKLKINKKIKKSELDTWKADGWKKGRKYKPIN